MCKSVKKKATRQTAYIKQVAEYIPCFNTESVSEIFKKEYKSKEKYINLAKLNFSDNVFFREYAIEMLKQFKLLKQWLDYSENWYKNLRIGPIFYKTLIKSDYKGFILLLIVYLKQFLLIHKFFLV